VHPLKKMTKPASEEQEVREDRIMEPEVSEAVPLDAKQELIQRHAQARAERAAPFMGATAILIILIVGVCVAGFWWLFASLFPKQSAPPVAISSQTSSTVQFFPVSVSSSTTPVSTSTERRLLLPLSPTSSRLR
jgi:cytoskeletal protein RodZ